ncbi:MAG TPA: BON domain-containing protein [Vicinamibacterales bacterium]|nr:BON domain-containing protein [Vicinamibacterales bacterium]
MKNAALAILVALTCAMATSCKNSLSDSSITDEVRTRLAGIPGTITVATNDGVVTLIGTVPDAQEKLKAGDRANEVAGVTRVVNNLRPTMAGDVPAPPAVAPPAGAGVPPLEQSNPRPAAPMP